jgi:ADP-ribose pyrophosphatase
MREQLRRYLELADQRPDWFANPPNAAFAILLDEAEIRLAEEQQAERLVARGQPADWATVGVIYEDQYLLLLRDAVRFLDGSHGTYIRFAENLRAPGAVAVLPVYDGKILLIRHFRHATRDWHLEIPIGGCEPGATTEEDARRELVEEIGGVARRLVSLGVLHSDIGMGGGTIELFYAEIERYGAAETVEGITDIVPVTPGEFEMLIRDGLMTTATPIAAFTYARAHGLPLD